MNLTLTSRFNIAYTLSILNKEVGAHKLSRISIPAAIFIIDHPGIVVDVAWQMFNVGTVSTTAVQREIVDAWLTSFCYCL